MQGPRVKDGNNEKDSDDTGSIDKCFAVLFGFKSMIYGGCTQVRRLNDGKFRQLAKNHSFVNVKTDPARIFWRKSLAGMSLPEQQTTHAYHSAPCLNGYFIIGTHPHAQDGKMLAPEMIK